MSRKNAFPEAEWNLQNSYAGLPGIFYSRLKPDPVSGPSLLFLNNSLAEFLGLSVQGLSSKEELAVLSGNRIPGGACPLAQAYAGHQFGQFTMLGDGRAHLLGEQITSRGERFDIQLKGSGKTPYSRQGDGRAPLGPVLREYIISEAMHALGIPTTRSLAVVKTGEKVIREKVHSGAILTRVAASHLRVGTFEYAARWASTEDLQALADYSLQRHFPDYSAADNRYLFLLKEVIKRQAALIARWQLVGFIHGVMNTDNMTISGETIDYGPCAFMDAYDPATVFSSIDRNGRYAYGNQPPVGAWNLARFAEALLPLLHNNPEQGVQLARDAIAGFSDWFNYYWVSGMRAKLGIFNEEENDEKLFKDLLQLMENFCADYTNTFRTLMYAGGEKEELFHSQEFSKWQELWQARLDRQDASQTSSQELMKRSNPAVIPRNHRVEDALSSAVNNEDYTEMTGLLEVLKSPYNHSNPLQDYYTQPSAAKTPYRTFCGT